MYALLLLAAFATADDGPSSARRHSKLYRVVEKQESLPLQYVVQPPAPHYVVQPPAPQILQADQSQQIATLQYSVNYYYTELQKALAALQQCQAALAPAPTPLIIPAPAAPTVSYTIAPAPAPASTKYVLERMHRRGSERVGDAGPPSSPVNKNSSSLSKESIGPK